MTNKCNLVKCKFCVYSPAFKEMVCVSSDIKFVSSASDLPKECPKR